MSKHTDFLLSSAPAKDNRNTMNCLEAYRENKFDTNQMHDDTPVRGMYDILSLMRQRRHQGQRLMQQTCCFGDLEPITREKCDVNFDLGNENWLQNDRKC